jgi:hypothetical protein
VNSTLKVRTPETRTLIDKIKADLKKRAETKAKRMLLGWPPVRVPLFPLTSRPTAGRTDHSIAGAGADCEEH